MPPLFRFASLEGVRHGISTRHGGTSPPPYATFNLGFATDDNEANVASNRARFHEALGVAPETPIAAHLHHGNTVAVFRGDKPDTWPVQTVPVRAGSHRTMRVFSADGVVSDAPGLYFSMTFADCVPLVFVDRTRGVVGAAHAGWRGTALGIGPAVIREMNAAFGSNPSDVVVGIGPSIGPCCYPVQPAVLDAFASNGLEPVVADGAGATRLDLWASNSQQLRDCGVPPGSIERADICTSCNVATYFSHRAEGGRTGRFGLGIGIDSGPR